MAKYKILLIDYEPRSIQRFVDPLEAAGYEVHVAKDGLSGIEAFHRIQPSVTLVEAMLPKRHGFEVCQELKLTPHGSRAKVAIATTVYKGRKYRTQAIHHYGCDEYIEKPITDEVLLATVLRLIGDTPPPDDPDDPDEPDEALPGKPAATAAVVSPAPAAPTAPVRSSDETEIEIMERLDEILGDSDS